MAKFLNTALLNEWIPKLIAETQKELVIVVPYIQTSAAMYQQLCEANKRGVETTLVFRENKLNPSEKQRLAALDNLNLFHHPNVHCKCYYNEKYLIIASMNLYEYSQKNNREMGVLFTRYEINNGTTFHSADPESIFQDAIKEIQEIVNGAHFEKRSKETETEGFEMNIMKTQLQQCEEECNVINKVFVHKRFRPGLLGNGYIPVCQNYFDKIDVSIDHRVMLDFKFEEQRIQSVFQKFTPYYHEFRIEGFKLYWNHWKQAIYLYRDGKHPMWQQQLTKEEDLALVKNGIDDLIIFFRKFL